MGVTYKPDIADDRESPSYVLMDLLLKKGAEVSFYDPLVSRIPPGRGRWSGRDAVPWNEQELSSHGAAVVCTGHTAVDYSTLADHVPLIVDACNVVPKNRKARVVAA